MQAISAVIITKNESENIERVLRSLSWCNEIVVVDSGSSDKTVDIAKSLGARVVFNEFTGYGVQKKFAVDQAKNHWVLRQKTATRNGRYECDNIHGASNFDAADYWNVYVR